MANQKLIYDLSQVSDALPQISPAMALLNVYMALVGDDNQVSITKNALANAVGKSKRTVSDWIIRLVTAGAIKYKYSGLTCLNPFFYYKGTEEGHTLAVRTWQEFKSDIPAQ